MTHLKRTIPSIPVTYYDERFTSVLAHKAMLEGGLKKKKRQDKGLVDEISAVIILQAYLESKKYQYIYLNKKGANLNARLLHFLYLF